MRYSRNKANHYTHTFSHITKTICHDYGFQRPHPPIGRPGNQTQRPDPDRRSDQERAHHALHPGVGLRRVQPPGGRPRIYFGCGDQKRRENRLRHHAGGRAGHFGGVQALGAEARPARWPVVALFPRVQSQIRHPDQRHHLPLLLRYRGAQQDGREAFFGVFHQRPARQPARRAEEIPQIVFRHQQHHHDGQRTQIHDRAEKPDQRRIFQPLGCARPALCDAGVFRQGDGQGDGTVSGADQEVAGPVHQRHHHRPPALRPETGDPSRRTAGRPGSGRPQSAVQPDRHHRRGNGGVLHGQKHGAPDRRTTAHRVPRRPVLLFHPSGRQQPEADLPALPRRKAQTNRGVRRPEKRDPPRTGQLRRYLRTQRCHPGDDRFV